nr:hypothetical protein [Mycobacterium riyadhense]
MTLIAFGYSSMASWSTLRLASQPMKSRYGRGGGGSESMLPPALYSASSSSMKRTIDHPSTTM